MKKLVLILTALLVGGCAAVTANSPKPRLTDETGEVYLYLELLPQDADRLSFSFGAISAVKADGQEIPLSVRLSEVKGGDIRRQRLLAVGVVPEGDYAGISFGIKKAAVRGEDGDSALLVPEKPEPKPFFFHVGKRDAVVVSLTLKIRESLKGGFRFDPVFGMQLPGDPLPALTGYVSSEGSDAVAVFDKRAARVMKMIETGRNPAGITIDQVQRRAYVALSGEDAVGIIDTNQNSMVSTIRLRAGDSPRDMALTPDGKMLLVVNSGSNTVSFVDPLSAMEFSRIGVGNTPGSIIIDRNGRRAYVCNSLSNTISVIDLAGRTIAGTIATESGPLRVQINRRGDRLMVIHSMSPNLLVVDPNSLSTLKKVFIGVGMSALKINPVTDLLYVGFRSGGSVQIFDPFSYIPGDFIPSDEGVASMTMDGDENNLVLVRPGSRTVQFLNLVSKKEAGVIDVGEDPYWVALFGER